MRRQQEQYNQMNEEGRGWHVCQRQKPGATISRKVEQRNQKQTGLGPDSQAEGFWKVFHGTEQSAKGSKYGAGAYVLGWLEERSRTCVHRWAEETEEVGVAGWGSGRISFMDPLCLLSVVFDLVGTG